MGNLFLKTTATLWPVLIAALQTDLDNGTDGLGALKALIDTANEHLNGTTATPNEYRIEAGVTQVITVPITD